MKKSTILALVFLGIATYTNAQNTILEARAKALGTVVTVKGIVTNGAEWGPIRYFQDNTAGIAAYGTSVNAVNIGDSVTITGTLKNYNGLLELDPLSSVVVTSPRNPLPDPIILTPLQIGETYEARLVEIDSATFNDAGGIFAGNKTYPITTKAGTVNIYVKIGQTDIIGQPIPHGLVNVTSILSQYTFTGSGGYQLLPRTIADIQKISAIYLTSPLNNSNLTKTELDFDWTTNITGSSEMYYGLSAATVKTNLASGIAASTNHSIALSGIAPGAITWVQAFSVNGNDTAFSAIMSFATISNSSGDIKVYFNTAVDNSYSTGVDAVDLYQAVDDTLINYINRAKYTIDLAIYNFNNSGISNISNALKAAADRGVTVRVIGCGTTANYGIDELAGTAVHTFIGPDSPPRKGIMHNKFFLFDTESTNANDPLVWTGSTNLTADQINIDANNVIIIQDQSLARGYKIEFEEMWGSNTTTPDAANAKFGSTKKNNTPHEYIINGKRVESYFSPTDGVNAQLIQHINTTNNDLSIATMLLTRDEIASAIASAKLGGAQVNMLTDASGNNGSTVNTTLLAALGTDQYIFYTVNPGIMHNKYMIIDQGAPESDPIAWTGSHNWSAAADNDNDENTLIIHDATIANIYYQNFVKLFVDNNGVLTGLSDLSKTSANSHLLVYPNPVQNGSVSVFCSLPSADKGTMQLFDITGKLVYESSIELTNGNNSLKYNFSHSFKGMYLLRLKTAKNEWNQKVLFE
jgi:phosphatidylserine/phosphatidylglycerophosphate/cardiolipin synthase-like enzyme